METNDTLHPRCLTYFFLSYFIWKKQRCANDCIEFDRHWLRIHGITYYCKVRLERSADLIYMRWRLAPRLEHLAGVEIEVRWRESRGPAVVSICRSFEEADRDAVVVDSLRWNSSRSTTERRRIRNAHRLIPIERKQRTSERFRIEISLATNLFFFILDSDVHYGRISIGRWMGGHDECCVIAIPDEVFDRTTFIHRVVSQTNNESIL